MCSCGVTRTRHSFTNCRIHTYINTYLYIWIYSRVDLARGEWVLGQYRGCEPRSRNATHTHISIFIYTHPVYTHISIYISKYEYISEHIRWVEDGFLGSAEDANLAHELQHTHKDQDVSIHINIIGEYIRRVENGFLGSAEDANLAHELRNLKGILSMAPFSYDPLLDHEIVDHGVLPCNAMCCSVLQCVCCQVSQYFAVSCSKLQ